MRIRNVQRKVYEETSFPMSALKQSKINLVDWVLLIFIEINQSESWIINLPIRILDFLNHKYQGEEERLSDIIASFRMLHEEFYQKLLVLRAHIVKQNLLELEKQQENLSTQVEQLEKQYLSIFQQHNTIVNNKFMEYLDKFYDIQCDCMDFYDKKITIQNLSEPYIVQRQLTLNVLLQIQNLMDIGMKLMKDWQQFIIINTNYELHTKFQLYIETQIIEIEQSLKQLQMLKSHQIKSPDIVLQGHRQKIIYSSLSTNNALIASISHDRTVRLWKISDQSILKTYQTDAWRTYFSPNELFLVTMHEKQIKIWDLTDLTKDLPMMQLLGHKGGINCLTISSNSKIIISGSGDKTMIVWNVENGSIIQEFQAYSIVRGVIITNNCNQVGCIGENFIRVWSLSTKTQLICQYAHEYGLELDLSQNQTLLISIGGENVIKIWDFSQATHKKLLVLLRKINLNSQISQYSAHQVYFSTDSKYFLNRGNYDKNIQIFNTATGKFIKSIIALGEDIEGVEINVSKDLNFVIAVVKDMTIKIWYNLKYLLNIQE